jgi:Co/Zn/Cd efflux system component
LRMLRISRQLERRVRYKNKITYPNVPTITHYYLTESFLSQHYRDHSHHSHHSHNDNAHSQCDEAMRITRIGMYVNLAMAACKGTVGAAINSSALIADAGHSLSDLLSDVVTLWSVQIARMPPDEDHPYGYGKFEAVGSLTVGAILTAAGVCMGWDAIQCLQGGIGVHASGSLSLHDLVDLSFLTSMNTSTVF